MTHITAILVTAQESSVQNSNRRDNPFLTESPLPYHIPPFDKIKDEHFAPAMEEGMREQLKGVELVANNSEKPTFDNTIVALERTGRLLDRAERTFSNLNACNTNPVLQKIDREMAPKLSAHRDAIHRVFFAAGKLYGLTFKERHDLPVYQPDVRVFEVYDRDGKPLALFLADYYARPSKRGGAWMNAYVQQSDLFGTKPVVANHLNIPKPPPGEPTLLTHDEVRTAFHEFGHALHGMFSNVKYPRFSGTNVPRDFVEYPSQVNEMWATWPEVLKNYAKHYKTGEPIPQALLDKVVAAEKFNQGHKTTEYLSATLLDQAWHQLNPPDMPKDAIAFEAQALHKAGVDFPPVPPRYRSPYFSHAFAGGYSAGYYSYIWSEVLDADSVEWMKEHGGLKRENGDRFRATLLSRGRSADALGLFKNFVGRDPYIEPLLKRRGLDRPPGADDSHIESQSSTR